jgi:hypothetical protein
MRTVGVIVAVIAIIAVAYAIIWPTITRRRASGPPITAVAKPAGAIESAEAYRNHLAMARWIEIQLSDDLVRTSVAEEEQAKARRLLDEFYGDVR